MLLIPVTNCHARSKTLASTSYKGKDAIRKSYDELAEKIICMEDMGKLPTDVIVEVLNNGEDDLGLSLFKNKASIHKNCRAKINEKK